MNTTEHLLTCLSEEASEVIKDCTKSLRFGLEDVNCFEPTGPNNLQRLIDELNDLEGVKMLLVQHGILPSDWRHPAKVHAKVLKVVEFMDYSRRKGILQ